MDTYIQYLKINKIRNITDLSILLSSEHRKHLIFTGKNGSGKTTVLLGIQKVLSSYESGSIGEQQIYDSNMRNIRDQIDFKNKHPETAGYYDQQTAIHREQIKNFPLHITISNSGNIKESNNTGNFMMVFFDSKRQSHFIKPVAIQKVALTKTINRSTNCR